MKFKKNETNNAVVTKLTNVRKHINADRLQIATVCGDTVIVGLDAREGDIVIYFDSNLSISLDFLKENNLFSTKERNKDTTKGGFFDKSGRVKPTNLRGERSYGFTTSLETIAKFVGVDVSEFKVDMEFVEINKINICKKYIKTQEKTPGMSGSHKTKLGSIMFKEHWDTKKFKKSVKLIPEGRLIYIEEKEHGTSQRSGFVICKRDTNWLEKALVKFGVKIKDSYWRLLNGTRRTNITRLTEPTIETVRDVVFNKIKDNIKKGEQLYYELSGYDTSGAWIQKNFPYGCEEGKHRDTLYRVTINSIDGDVYDMSREYVYRRAEDLGMNKPHLFEKYYFDGDVDKLINVVDSYTDGRSMINDDTLREGVVVWYENFEGKWTCLKNKSFDFLNFESKAKDKDDYVDMEEMEE